MAQEALLKVIDLATHFTTEEGTVKAVDGVDFEVRRGEVVGVVGESGFGKSITSMSVLRLIAKPQGNIVRGKIVFEGQDLLTLSEEDMRKIRGNKIALISQDPMTSLNPVLTVGEQIMEAIMLHQGLDREAAKKKAEEERIARLRADNCERARRAKSQLTSGQLLTTTNAKGERGFMDDATREAELRRADAPIASD